MTVQEEEEEEENEKQAFRFIDLELESDDEVDEVDDVGLSKNDAANREARQKIDAEAPEPSEQFTFVSGLITWKMHRKHTCILPTWTCVWG